MSLKFIVELRGKRTTVNVTPMAPLQKIIDEVCTQQKPQLDVQGCRLYFQKKLLDPTIPVRFANLPKEAKLELVTGKLSAVSVLHFALRHPPILHWQQEQKEVFAADQPERRLGLADSSTATNSAPAAATPADKRFAQVDTAPATERHQLPAESASQIEPMDTAPAAISTQPTVPNVDNAADHAGSGHATVGTQSRRTANVNAAENGQQVQASSSSLPSTNHSGVQQTTTNNFKQHPGNLDRQIHVFTRQAAATAEASSRGETDLPEDFYDFTSDDYQKVMSSWARKNSQASGPLKTQKLRDQDERKRAEQIGPVPVRIHFPDDSIIQADFKALETLAAVHDLIHKCLDSGVPKWYTYVTPPKQILKDRSLTLYKAGLIPAANVLVGTEGEYKGSYLQPQIAALQAPPPARSIAEADAASTESQAKAASIQNGSGASFLPSSKATGTGEKKVPKWMKLGK